MTDITALLTDIKNYLNITWNDDKTDSKITGFINRGMKRLQDIAGASLDFTAEDLPRSLLFDYCRYANSQALEVFEKNFESELLELNLGNQFTTPEKLTVISAIGTSTGYTTISTSPQLDNEDSYMYKLGVGLFLPGYFDICDAVSGYVEWNGADEIKAIGGNDIVVVELDENFKAIRAGKTTVVVR